LLVMLAVGCAPVVDGPAERQREADRADAARLTAQLSALPGVVRAEVMLRRPAADPLAVTPAGPPATSVVLIVDDRADRASLTTTARTLAKAVTPAVEPAIVVEVGAERPVMASVGPFRVDEKSRTPLRAVLAIILALVLVLATWVAYREHQRRRR
jgi:hypothetical protein